MHTLSSVQGEGGGAWLVKTWLVSYTVMATSFRQLTANMPRTKKPKVIGASTSTSKRQWPQGLPEGLVVRGTGQTLLDKLEAMGEHAQDLVGIMILHVNIETHEVLGPELLLRGPQVVMGLKPKSIWGEVSGT